MPASFHHTFANGLTLLAEAMPHVRSAAINVLLPAGCAYEPPEFRGLATVLAEMITRGAGPRDSRELSDAFDQLGLDRDESAGLLHLRMSGSTLGRNLVDVLALYADVIRRPHLPEDELESVQALTLQDLQALEDSPQQKVMIELRRRYYPGPLGNDRHGTAEGISALTPAALRTFHQRRVRPAGTIISVAGQIDWPNVLDTVGRLFGDWSEPAADLPLPTEPSPTGYSHIEKDLEQTQIALAGPSVPIGHADYYAANAAVRVLSGGMSARLFTEVREKEGLCYAISANYQTYKHRGDWFCYAGTSTARAQETLTITLRELRRLADGVTAEEVARVQAGLKSSLVMSQESSGARAGALASDWYYLGRIRPLAEIQAEVDALTPAIIDDHLRRYSPGPFTVVTLGRSPLEVPSA